MLLLLYPLQLDERLWSYVDPHRLCRALLSFIYPSITPSSLTTDSDADRAMEYLAFQAR